MFMEFKGGSNVKVKTGSANSSYCAGVSIYTKGVGSDAEKIPACGYGLDLITDYDEKGFRI